MTLVTASIDIDAPRERVYDLMLDPARLDEWVTIHRRVNTRGAGQPREGYEMDQTLCLRGSQLQGPLDAHRGQAAEPRDLGGPRAGPLLRPHQLRADGPRRRPHALRLRERVQGARRLPRRRREPDADRRRAPAGGEPLAAAAQGAAGKRASGRLDRRRARPAAPLPAVPDRCSRRCALPFQGITGVSELALFLAPLFVIGALLLCGRYVGEEKIVARWRAAVASGARAAAPSAGARAPSARFAPSSCRAPSASAGRRPRPRRPPD